MEKINRSRFGYWICKREKILDNILTNLGRSYVYYPIWMEKINRSWFGYWIWKREQTTFYQHHAHHAFRFLWLFGVVFEKGNRSNWNLFCCFQRLSVKGGMRQITWRCSMDTVTYICFYWFVHCFLSPLYRKVKITKYLEKKVKASSFR